MQAERASYRYVRSPRSVIEIQARKEMADLYRSVRRDRPAAPRLLYRRIKAANKAILGRAFEGSTSLVGLADLISGQPWRIS
jgi:hypothetical protein